MQKKTIRYDKIIIAVVFAILLTYYFGMKYLATRPRYKTLPEVRLVNQKEESTKGFAVMVPNESGDGYEEYTSEDGAWPSEGYEFKEAKCIDNDGQLVEGALTFADGKATLTTSQTVYCTMYFDKKPETIKILREKDTQKYLSEDPQGGMYRYQVAPSSSSDAANMTNWICFGTKDQSACKNDIDKYMYRIIGITKEGQMYLIKETFLKEGSATGFAWNDEYTIRSSDGTGTYCPNGKCPEWNEADLFQRINGKANGTKSGNGDANDGVDNDTDIFVDSTQYDYLKSGDENGTKDGIGNEWYQLIADHDWMYGDTITGYNDANTYNGDKMYAIETGAEGGETQHYIGTYYTSSSNNDIKLETYRWPSKNKVTAKISLMYIHDYIYAYPAGIPGSYSSAKNSWIFFQKDGYNSSPTYEWLSTRWGVYSTSSNGVRARYVYDDGAVSNYYLALAYGARPVFYLASQAKIVDGDGTKASPYTLG